MEGTTLSAPPANEKCYSCCPARATDTVAIKNVEGVFYFCHHHASKLNPNAVESQFSTVIPEVSNVPIRHH